MCINLGHNFNPLDLLDLSGQAKRSDANDNRMKQMAEQIAALNAEQNAPKTPTTTMQAGAEEPEQTAAARNAGVPSGSIRNPLRVSVAAPTSTPGASSGLNVPV
jgi:hypothetical protein